MRQLQSSRAKEWAQKRLTTIGQTCRAVAEETLGDTFRWALAEITETIRKPQHVLDQLGLI